MRVLKVWAAYDRFKGKQIRVIVCSKTKKKALELLKNTPFEISAHCFNNNWFRARNDVELGLIKEGEGIWISSGYMEKDFICLKDANGLVVKGIRKALDRIYWIVV